MNFLLGKRKAALERSGALLWHGPASLPPHRIQHTKKRDYHATRKSYKGKIETDDINAFSNMEQPRIKILPDGRYEVELPWKYDSLKLPSNKGIGLETTWKG
ncbi:hypothetical protein TNCV_1891801 [Trichonephila clavipes]|nr:hypothetical protein TNCV_1891801 [Trichonephila clavipes]